MNIPIGLTNGFTTSEENYVAVCAFMAKLYPYVNNDEAQAGIVQLLKEMVSIYPNVFELKFFEGKPMILIKEERKQ
jgi:pyridoxal/pyridoxine/pyridoxamine kinase